MRIIVLFLIVAGVVFLIFVSKDLKTRDVRQELIACRQTNERFTDMQKQFGWNNGLHPAIRNKITKSEIW